MQQISHDLAQRLEVIQQLEPVVKESISGMLLNPDKAWQPTDFLPDLTQPDFAEQIAAVRERAAGIPDEVIMSLIGNMITEEALPSYQTYINLVPGINDERNLTSTNSWVSWTRAWTAEENRHGDLLNKYLYLSGRADMREVEVTIHWLLNNGFNPETDADPYNSMVYTSFQERATKISHMNTARLADKAGDTALSKICRTIAGDEARHEKAYQTFMACIFDLDPNGAMLAFEQMMRRQIAMPAIRMDHGDVKIFDRYAAITQKIGIYTAFDYSNIIDYLVDRWNIEKITGLNAAAAKAQEFLCNLSARYNRIAERTRIPNDISLAWLSA
jgi:acyl-[acyl-carrier-protein] desaturase